MSGILHLKITMQKGILSIYKPLGITSYDVIRVLKKHFPGEKIGHGGTLDPLAEGVLVVAVGREATKQLHSVLNGTQKEYRAKIELGKTSETDDAEGPITDYAGGNGTIPSRDDVEKALRNFVGDITQTPPDYSAVKVQGMTAYKRARTGQKIALAPKQVHIEHIDVLSYTYPTLEIQVVCGSGVYIRALARDLGEALKTGAYLTGLQRTRVGDFTSDTALQLDSFKE